MASTKLATQPINPYGAAATASARGEVDRAVMDAYHEHRKNPATHEPQSTPEAMRKLRSFRSNATRPNASDAMRQRAEAIRQSLDRIEQLTEAWNTELQLRRVEFRSAASGRATPVPDREVLGQWLQEQAVAAHDSDIEKSYFTQLKEAFSPWSDPWTVSRRVIGQLQEPGNEEQAARLKAAHVRLVRAMAGGLSQLPAAPQPGRPTAAVSVSRERLASASPQQDIIERLIGRIPLSDIQIHSIRFAVAQGIASGRLGESTSNPEAWARDLLDRIQASFNRQFGDLTSVERERESYDLKHLGELVEKLAGLGYL